MSQFDDLPIVQLRPGPTDAELQADRDAKHAIEVAEFHRRLNRNDADWDDWPILEVIA